MGGVGAALGGTRNTEDMPEKLYDYLFANLSIEKPELVKSTIPKKEGLQIVIELEEDVDKIRDWAGEKLQKVGIDKDYKLTREGEYLEEIIDILYS